MTSGVLWARIGLGFSDAKSLDGPSGLLDAEHLTEQGHSHFLSVAVKPIKAKGLGGLQGLGLFSSDSDIFNLV
jgi:hypothetical protein